MRLRLRLTLLYGGLFAAVLGFAMLASYLAHAEAHLDDIDADLYAAWRVAEAEVRDHPDAVPAPAHGAAGLALFDVAARQRIGANGDEPQSFDDRALTLPDGFLTVALANGRVRSLGGLVDGAAGRWLVATTPLGELDAEMRQMAVQLATFWLVGVWIAAAGGWIVSESALRPIAAVTETAREIADSRDFSRRVPPAPHADELGDLTTTVNEMLARLDEAHTTQRRFVGDVSHELRTPLTTIGGNAELLARAPLAPEEATAVARIRGETARLGRLVDDLLALARADSGPAGFRDAPVHFDEVLMEAFDQLRESAGRRLGIVELESAIVRGDRDRLKQLALILLDNALRYTPAPGKVEASLSVAGADVVLRVEDEGIGIAPEALPRVFERFYRGDEARRLDPSGTGLGLAIARWIVEGHRGGISLRARQPRGTAVTVRLPLAAVGAAA